MRTDFFGTEPDRSDLERQALSQDSSLRWAAAVELSELQEFWALEILWQLRLDPDEHVRSVAERGVAQAPSALLSELTAAVNREFDDANADRQQDRRSTSGLAPFFPWKTRPVDPPGPENAWAASVVVTDIVATEGPVTGARVLRLYGESAFPNSPRKIKRNWVEKAVDSLIQRARISRVGSSGLAAFEDWTLQRTGDTSTQPRERGSRRVSEIPVVEIQLALEHQHGRRAKNLSRDRKFLEILRIYGIDQNEYHLVGAALEKEWLELLN